MTSEIKQLGKQGFVTRHRNVKRDLMSPKELAFAKFPVNIPNQNFALISYAGPRTIPANGIWALRIYGTFATFDEASRVADEAQDEGFDMFDIDIVEINQGFFPMPPPSDEDLDVVKYKDKRMMELMGGHRDKVQDGNAEVIRRADQKTDKVETVADVFDNMVTAEAIRLFKEWKKRGKTERRAVIKEKLNHRFKEQMDAYTKKVHGPEANTRLNKKDSQTAHKEAVEQGLLSKPAAGSASTSTDAKAAAKSILSGSSLVCPPEHQASSVSKVRYSIGSGPTDEEVDEALNDLSIGLDEPPVPACRESRPVTPAASVPALAEYPEASSSAAL